MPRPEREQKEYTLYDSDMNSYKEEIETWSKVMRGGVIVCETYGKAINLRYRMYTIRKKLQSANGQTPYDDLTMKLARDDNRIFVKPRSAGVVEIIPADTNEQEIMEQPDKGGDLIISRKRKPLIGEAE